MKVDADCARLRGHVLSILAYHRSEPKQIHVTPISLLQYCLQVLLPNVYIVFLLYATLPNDPAVLSTLSSPFGGFPGEPFQRSRPARESVELSRRILRASLRSIASR